MTKPQELVESYIAHRRSMGDKFESAAVVLRAFGRAVAASPDIDGVGPGQVESFLNGSGPVTSAWHIRHTALLGFYRYATSRGHASSMPLPAKLPKRPPPFVPYIYSHEELRRLLDVIGADQAMKSIEPATFRAVILLMYATGLRVREAVALDQADVDLPGSVLTIRKTKFHKSRLVPFSPALEPSLARHATARPGTQAPFFTTRDGARVKQGTLRHCFLRHRDKAGIRRTDKARYQPRLHDLRHTFAVHRLTSWYRQGKDVQRLLPQLSIYLGHARLADTQAYLSMTPELLQEASARFESYASGGASHG